MPPKATEELSEIMIDTQSFKDSKVLAISNVDEKEILEYALSYANTVYDIEYEDYKALNSNSLLISLVEMKEKVEIVKDKVSGDIIKTLTDADINKVTNSDLNDTVSNGLNEVINNSINSADVEEMFISGNSIVLDEKKTKFDEYKGKYICTVIVSMNKNSRLINYEIEYKNEKWNITEIITE